MTPAEIQEALDATNLRPSDLLRAERQISKWNLLNHLARVDLKRHGPVRSEAEIAQAKAHLEAMRPLVARRQKALKELKAQGLRYIRCEKGVFLPVGA